MLADISNPSPALGCKIKSRDAEFSLMRYYEVLMRILQGLLLLALAVVALPAQKSAKPPERSEEHTSELQSPCNLVCRLLLEKKKTTSTCHPLLSTRQYIKQRT